MGFYPTVPGRRMAWDDDGSIGFSYPNTGGVLVEISAQDKVDLNGEDNDQWYVSGSRYVGVFFPELRDIDGIFIEPKSVNQYSAVDTSADTTNGIDGTWTNRIANYNDAANVASTFAHYRATGRIESLSVTGARAIRANMIGNDQTFGYHVYGNISSGQTPDRLLFVDDSSGLEFTLPLDYEDVPRGMAVDNVFKVKNNSSTLQANTVQLTAEALKFGSGAWYTFSSGGAFQATLNIGNLTATSSSSTITLRQIISTTAAVGLHAGRIQLSVGSWT